MTILIECTEIGISILVEAVQSKLNEYSERFDNETNWPELQYFYRVRERTLHNIMVQIAAQVNKEEKQNDN